MLFAYVKEFQPIPDQSSQTSEHNEELASVVSTKAFRRFMDGDDRTLKYCGPLQPPSFTPEFEKSGFHILCLDWTKVSDADRLDLTRNYTNNADPGLPNALVLLLLEILYSSKDSALRDTLAKTVDTLKAEIQLEPNTEVDLALGTLLYRLIEKAVPENPILLVISSVNKLAFDNFSELSAWWERSITQPRMFLMSLTNFSNEFVQWHGTIIDSSTEYLGQ